MSPSIEYRLSNTISLAVRGRPREQFLEMRQVVVAEDHLLRAAERRMPSIMELWFSASDRIRQSGSRPAMVEMPARFEIQPDVKTSAPILAVQVGEFGLELHDG